MSKKFICPVCGYVYEGDEMPEKCPVCGKPMQEVKEEGYTWAAEHVVGVAKGVREDIMEDLRANFNGECCEVVVRRFFVAKFCRRDACIGGAAFQCHEVFYGIESV